MEADISTQAVGLASSADFSLIKFFGADIVVKSVIIILIVLVYSWQLYLINISFSKK